MASVVSAMPGLDTSQNPRRARSEMEASENEAPAAGTPRKRKRARKVQSDRKYDCTFEGCGKSYSRAEHLYRHQLNRRSWQYNSGMWLTARRCPQADLPMRLPRLLPLLRATGPVPSTPRTAHHPRLSAAETRPLRPGCGQSHHSAARGRLAVDRPFGRARVDGGLTGIAACRQPEPKRAVLVASVGRHQPGIQLSATTSAAGCRHQCLSSAVCRRQRPCENVPGCV